MARLCRAFDWSATPLGPASTWSISLRAIASALIVSRQPMLLFWGAELTQIYNDDFRPSLGYSTGPEARHPGILGRPGAESWAAAWDTLGPQVRQVLDGGESIWFEDLELPNERNGRIESVWWTYSFSAVRDEDGSIAGVLIVCAETTGRVRADRELSATNQRLREQTEELEAQAEELQSTAAQLEALTEEATEARERTERVLETMGDAFFQTDPQFRFVAVNSAMERQVEMSRAELLGQSLWEKFPGAAGTEVERAYRGAVERGVEAHFVHDYSDARLNLVVEVDVYPSNGGIAVFWRDVTARAHADEERARLARAIDVERNRLIEIIRKAPAFMAVVRGPEHRFELVNDAYLRLVGNRTIVPGTPMFDAVPESKGQGFEELADHVISTGEPFVGESLPVKFVQTAGQPPEERIVDLAFIPLTEIDGTRSGVMIVGSDVTDQVRGRRAIERSRDLATRLQALTATLAAATSTDQVSNIVVEQSSVAGATTAWIGFRGDLTSEPDGSADEIVMMRHHGFPEALLSNHRRFPISAASPSSVTFRTGETLFIGTREELLERFPAVRDVWDRMDTHALVSVPLSSSGEVVGVLTFTFAQTHEFTDEDRTFFTSMGGQAAQALERARLLAAERAARGDAENARTVAEAASQARAEFLATMSHEIRTPINAIVGYTQLLEMGVPDAATSAQRQQLHRIAATASHLNGLVNDILDTAKIDAGEMSVTRELATLDPVISAVFGLMRSQADERDVSLVDARHDAPDLPYLGDEGRVRQILINLFSNAVKFTASGGSVRVETGMSKQTPSFVIADAPGPWSFVRVTDTGIGIAPEHQITVFEPFVQAESGKTRTKGGTGLGLTISRRLARLMGGDLTLKSTAGAGSEFTLWLPSGHASERIKNDAVVREADGTQWRVPGLAEVGQAMRDDTGGLVEAYVAALRTEPSIPLAAQMSRSELEDHVITVIANLSQSLIILGDGGDEGASLMRDGSEIQRAVAEVHGIRRFEQGWSDDAVVRELDVFVDVVERFVRARVAPRVSDIGDAVEVLAKLQARTTEAVLAAYRNSVRRA
jgi:PAS domain S-box-containing protein